MAFGLNITNINGVKTIGEDYYAFQVVASGSSANNGSLPTPASNQLLFIKPSSIGATIYASTTGGTYVKATSGNIDWVLAQYAIAANKSGWGLQVFNAAGAICFDTNNRYLRPVSVSRLTGGSALINQPFSLPTGKARYINASCLRVVGITDPNGYQTFWIHTYATWHNTSQMTVGIGSVVYEAGPYVDYGMNWAGTAFFSFADL